MKINDEFRLPPRTTAGIYKSLLCETFQSAFFLRRNMEKTCGVVVSTYDNISLYWEDTVSPQFKALRRQLPAPKVDGVRVWLYATEQS